MLPFLPVHYSQDETSEEFLGEWMESRGNRDQIVLATKVVHCGQCFVTQRS